MKNQKKVLFICLINLLVILKYSTAGAQNKSYVIADQFLFDQLAIKSIRPQVKNNMTNVSVAVISEYQKNVLSHVAHTLKKCGGFTEFNDFDTAVKQINELDRLEKLNSDYLKQPYREISLAADEKIKNLLSQIDENRIKNDILWLSSYNNRTDTSAQPNRHVLDLKEKLAEISKEASFPILIETVSHSKTKQFTLKATIEGAVNSNEILILGGHLDSINQMAWFGSDKAPGVDDNASGAANLMEVFRQLVKNPQPNRTIEFYWYAAEEKGLVGSDEIAKKYKAANKKVVGVIQLDMTLLPASGENVIASMTDYTSQWLSQYLEKINEIYLNAKIIYGKCGYGCSDHASWHNQGYPALMPFESDTSVMNKNIHTANDLLSGKTSLKHSVLFTKVALAFALTLGNSSDSQPY